MTIDCGGMAPVKQLDGSGVSVVLATITVDPWLDAAVDSVISQRGVPVELIVVHDGVPADPTRDWTRHPRVKIVELPDRGGLANALNQGIARANDEFIARLDADDVSIPDRLQRQHGLLNEGDAIVVGSGAERIDGTGAPVGFLQVSPASDAREQLLWRNAVVHSSVMFRRSAMIQAGGYRAELRQMEDYDLWLRLALVGRIEVTRTPEVQYRVHPDQMSRGASPRGLYIHAILHGRRKLARLMGVNPATQRARDAAWLAANYARYYGIKKPGPS